MPPSDDAGSAGWRQQLATHLLPDAPTGDPSKALIAGVTPDYYEELQLLMPREFARAAVLVPIVDRPSGPSVLLTERASHLKRHPGQISFPGGHMEQDDDGPWGAALREAEEEIGLPRHHVTLAGYLIDHIVVSGFVVTPVVGIVRPGFDLRLDRTEVESAFEVPLAHVMDPANHVRRERVFGGRTIAGWDIPYGDRHIWGATAGMLMTLYRTLNS